MPGILKSRLFWALAVPVVLVGLYAFVGFRLAPGIVRDQAQKFVRENYGRMLAIGEIRIQPFTLQIDVLDLALRDVDEKPLLSFERLSIDFEIASLWNGAFTFRRVTIDAPRVRAFIRPDGALNLADLALPAEPGMPDSLPPRIWIQKLEVGRGQITFADQARRKPFEQQFRDVGLVIADFRTTPEGANFRLSARSTDDATFEWKGRLALAPVIASQGEFRVGGLRVPRLLDFLGDARPFTSKTGAIDLAGSYRVALAEPFELEVELPEMIVRDVGLLAPGAEAPWVQVPSVVVSGFKAALPAQTLTIERVAVNSLKAQAWLNADRSVNLAALFAPPAPAAGTAPGALPEPTTAKTAPRPWTVGVKGIEFTAAVIEFEDRAVAPGTRFTMAPVNLRLSDASLDLSQPLQFGMDAVINEDARFYAKGTLTPAPLAASLDLRLERAQMTSLQPYVRPLAGITITAGQLDVAGKFELAQAGRKVPALTFAGAIAIDQLKTVDNALKQDFFNFEKLELSKIQYAMAPDSISVDRIVVIEPYARVIIGPEGVTNITAVLNPQGTAKAPDERLTAEAAEATKKAETPSSDVPADTVPIRISELRIDRMRMNFTDNFIQPNFAADVQQLSGTIAGVSNTGATRAKVSLKGRLGEFSPVSIEGELQPFAFDRYTDMKLRFENIPLPIFNPYSGPLAGYNIAKGQLTTGLHYIIRNRQLDAGHKIRIQQLEWGEATVTKSEATLPVKFAAALLKDRYGVIDLDVPVGGTLDDPSFKIGPIIWQAIGNITTKAVTAPFSVLGAMFEGAEEAQFVDFSPGSSALDPTIAERLAALGKSLVEKPEVTLEVPIGTLTALDMPALAARAYDAALARAVASRFGTDGNTAAPAYASLEAARKIEILSELLMARTGSVPQSPTPPVPPALTGSAARAETAVPGQAAALAHLEQAARAAVTVPETDLAPLGEERALVLTRALLAGTGLDPARVLTVNLGKVTVGDGKVRLQLALK